MIKIKTIFFSFLISAFCIQNLYAKTEVVESDKAIQKAILYYVNEYRASRHLKPLQMNNQMSEEAAQHSRDMARKAVPFGHKYFDRRIHRLYGQIKDCQSGSENVAYNYRDGRDVVKNWLTSSGHRKNIEGNYNLTGIGLARDKRGKLYFTQIFIRTADPTYTQRAH